MLTQVYMKCPIDFLVIKVIKGLLKPEAGRFLTVCYVDFTNSLSMGFV